MLRKQSAIANGNKELTIWTTRVDGTLASLIRQFTEKLGAIVDEEGEWDTTERQE